MAGKLSGMADNEWLDNTSFDWVNLGEAHCRHKDKHPRNGLSVGLSDENCHTIQPAPRKTSSEAPLYCWNVVCGGVWRSVESGLGWRGEIHIQLIWTVNRIPQQTPEREALEKSRWDWKDKKSKVAVFFMVACGCLRLFSLIFDLLSFTT